MLVGRRTFESFAGAALADCGCPQPHRARSGWSVRFFGAHLPSAVLQVRTAALSFFCCLALLLLPHRSGAADSPTLRPQEARAVLVFKIAQFTDWPKEAFESDSSPFVMGILGDDPFKSDISVIDGKTIKGRQFVVKHFSNPQEATKCQLLFISSSEESRVSKVLKALENSSVMTFAEMGSFDGIVKIVQQATKGGLANLHFEINRAAAERAKLKINSQILALSSKK